MNTVQYLEYIKEEKSTKVKKKKKKMMIIIIMIGISINDEVINKIKTIKGLDKKKINII